MKTLRIATLLVLFLALGQVSAQQSGAVARGQETDPEQQEGKNTIKEIEQINQASAEISATASNTTDAVKSTVANSKETLGEIKSLFGPSKGKKAKGTVTIGIAPITYDDPDLNALYEHITGVRGVKNPNKNFSDGHVTITVEYKENADALWQRIPNGCAPPLKWCR